MAKDQGQASPPPADLATRALPLRSVEGVWHRIGRREFPPRHFSNSSGWRFSHEDQPGVLYLGDRPETCFWEVFWDDLVSRPATERRLDLAQVASRVLWALPLPGRLRVVDTTSAATLRAIRAHAGTFLGPYANCQSWAAALRAHPSEPDGLLYPSAREAGGLCLALFAERCAQLPWAEAPEPRPLLQDLTLARLVLAEGIAVLD